ncbi:MAG TPA: PAS domain S-box protein [Bacteroidales bacterium]|nr:PAS domain S-box protein [Bacteroidales bacterium]
MESTLSFSPSQFGRFFPYYLLLDVQSVIVSCGKEWDTAATGLTGKPVTDSFSLGGPQPGRIDFDRARELQGLPVLLEGRFPGQPALLEGTFTWLPRENQVVFTGKPVSEEKAEAGTDPDRWKMKERLRILSAITEQNTQGVVITDRLGRIDWVNPSFENMSGYSLEELRGKRPETLLRGDDTSSAAVRYLREQVRKGEPFECDILNYRKSGTPYWLRLRGMALRTESGEVTRYFAIEEDITHLKEAEKALLESEARYRDLIENVNEIVYETDENGTITYISPALEKVLGYTQEEIIGKNYLYLLGDSDEIKVAKLADLTENKVLIVEHELHNKQGELRWIRFSTTAVVKDGRLMGGNGVLIDITDKKVTEENLRKSESRMTALIRNLKGGVLLEDEHRRIVITNQNFCDMFGVPAPPESLKGADCSMSAEQSKHLFRNPDEFMSRIAVVLREGKPALNEELEMANGHFFLRDYIPITIDGDSRGHLWKYVDITDQKIQEVRLKQKEEQYRNIIANMKMGLLETDLDDTIEYVNQQFCEMTGYTTAELLGQKSVDLLVAEDFRGIVREKSRLRINGTTDTYEVQVRVKGGGMRWWLTSGGPNFNDKGALTGTIGISVDITGQKALEEELKVARRKAEESSRAKEAFLAHMSHEIRTPLNAILGMIREISREPMTAKQHFQIQNAGLASQHLLSIVNDVLDLTKIESGQMSLENTAFSLQSVINSAVSILTPGAEDKNLKLHKRIAPELSPAYLGDANRIKQILLNLLTNAIKFTEKGEVSVECTFTPSTEGRHRIQLSVTDTGIGMDEDFLSHLFDKFSQGDPTTARKYGGTGLGMAITRELVQLMNGTVQVTSRKGAGSRFEILLELEPVAEGPADIQSTLENFNELEKTEVLLVEDNSLSRLVAHNALSHYGISVTEAVNGAEAVEILKEKRFDLILMDLQMPVMDGLTATACIRKELKLDTPVIALTANAFKAELDRCIASGMNDYITKPFEESALLGTIYRHVRQITDSSSPADSSDAKTEKLYSLEYIEQFSRGNEEFVKKMIRVFLDEIAPAIPKIKPALLSGDLATVRKLAHFVKPTIDSFGINIVKEDIRMIESWDEKKTPVAHLENLVDKLEQVMARVARELENEVK